MRLISFLGLIITAIITVITYIVFYKKAKAIAKFEFENRTSGGAIEFASYEEAEKHRFKKWRVNMMMFLFIPEIFFLIVFGTGTFG